jgi:hypothetical protein
MAVNSFGDNLERQSIIFCKIRYYLVVSLPDLATYYLLLSTMDRCLATCNSVRMRAWSELKVAHRLSVAVFILGLVSNVHLLVFYTIYKNNCQLMPDRNYTLTIFIYTIVAAILLPYTLMLILCVITFMNMKRTKRRVIPVANTLNRQQTHRFEYHIIKACTVAQIIFFLSTCFPLKFIDFCLKHLGGYITSCCKFSSSTIACWFISVLNFDKR